MSGRAARVSGLLRRLSARLERDRWEALNEPASDRAWQAGFCEGLAHAQHVLRNGA
ncbi:hypothetical protein SAMN05421630_101723 [Prauserella marina]|uniref:Uncharacterized protein n=1 Tax=Prauserella marina TaxID=530584 RepID=A0A1G6JHV4_9PSEU|nr:hypothetical protein DES30_101613 [Prauserella marina]SDC18228.1 hypothetical protein SAMN05421630_101723 [Prauserella marina]